MRDMVVPERSGAASAAALQLVRRLSDFVVPTSKSHVSAD